MCQALLDIYGSYFRKHDSNFGDRKDLLVEAIRVAVPRVLLTSRSCWCKVKGDCVAAFDRGDVILCRVGTATPHYTARIGNLLIALKVSVL